VLSPDKDLLGNKLANRDFPRGSLNFLLPLVCATASGGASYGGKTYFRRSQSVRIRGRRVFEDVPSWTMVLFQVKEKPHALRTTIGSRVSAREERLLSRS